MILMNPTFTEMTVDRKIMHTMIQLTRARVEIGRVDNSGDATLTTVTLVPVARHVRSIEQENLSSTRLIPLRNL